MSEDSRVIGIVGQSEIVLKSVEGLRMKTIDDEGERKEGEGVSVREKNGILGILLEVVEGQVWKGGYEELEEVVGRLEEEGKKEWRERKKDGREGMEWKEMGRLAREVGWAIEERKMEMEGEGGKIVTLGRMKKELEEEKKGREEAERGREEEKKRADEERMKVEQIHRELEEEKKGREEEKKRANKLESELRELKERPKEGRHSEEEKRYAPITSLQALPYYAPNDDEVTRNGNRLSGSKSNSMSTIIGPQMESVCYDAFHFLTSVPLYSRAYIECILLHLY